MTWQTVTQRIFIHGYGYSFIGNAAITVAGIEVPLINSCLTKYRHPWKFTCTGIESSIIRGICPKFYRIWICIGGYDRELENLVLSYYFAPDRELDGRIIGYCSIEPCLRLVDISPSINSLSADILSIAHWIGDIQITGGFTDIL